MKKRFLSILLTFAMMLSLMPGMSIMASAEDSVTYIERTWDGEKIVETEKECPDYIVFDKNTSRLETGTWYVVNSNVTNMNRVTVSGTANLILVDDCTLTLTRGITVETPYGKTGNTLNIYGQSGDSGKLIAVGSTDCAGIGGGDLGDGGIVNIYGGTVDATGYISHSGYGGAAGIGGGDLGDGGSVTVYGGTVAATGGDGGAGIGGGDQGRGGNVTIYSGTVTATGGGCGAGIGGGRNDDGGNVIIYGGAVAATGGLNSAAIGGGYEGSGGNVTICGGSVTASSGGQGRAIGAGYGGLSDGTVNVADEMLIKGGENVDNLAEISEVGTEKYVYITRNTTDYQITYVYRCWDEDTGRVIEEEKTLMPGDYTVVTRDTTLMDDGWYVVTEDVTVSNGIWVIGDVNLILCDGAKLEAQNGIIVRSLSFEEPAMNNLTIYGQANDSGELIATCSDYARQAGIGGLDGEKSGNITVNGGTVTATSESGAGIGGGSKANGTVTINGGTVTATSKYGAGIGGGKEGNGSVTISGGTVTATSKYGAGVGDGDNGSGSTIALSNGVTFGAGADTEHITVIGDKNNVSDTFGQHYFVTPYAHEHSFISGVCAVCGYIDPAVYDLTGDGEVTDADLTLLLRHVAKIAEVKDTDILEKMDFNHDDSVDAGDITRLAKCLASKASENN